VHYPACSSRGEVATAGASPQVGIALFITEVNAQHGVTLTLDRRRARIGVDTMPGIFGLRAHVLVDTRAVPIGIAQEITIDIIFTRAFRIVALTVDVSSPARVGAKLVLDVVHG